MEHWIQHDQDLHEAAHNYFTEIKDRLEESLHIAAEYLSHQSVAGNGGTLPKPSNPFAQGGPMDQSSNRHTNTGAWIMAQNEVDRLGTLYEIQLY